MIFINEQEITKYWDLKKYKKPLISVDIITYNHELYISQCLDGILMQKTEYPFEIIIHDDASTDKTADIIRKYEKKYPNIIKPIYETENQYSKKDDSLTKIIQPHLKGKYIALCEGDDFWCDSDKLQIQCSFMENNPDFSMCMHNAYRMDSTSGEKQLLNTFDKEGEKTQREQLLAGLTSVSVATASYFLRADLWNKQPELFKTVVGDYPIRMWYASQGKTFYFAKSMSVYRVNSNESYMSRLSKNFNMYQNYVIEMSKFYIRLDDFYDRKFHDILQHKINGDIMGFCSKIEKNKASEILSKLGYTNDDINKIYSLLSPKELPESLIPFTKSDSKIFIYGTSNLGKICYKQLQNNNIKFEGFVVSDNVLTSSTVDNQPVYKLGYVLEKFSNPCFILALQELTSYEILEKLQKLGVKSYCIPYKLEKN